MADAPLLGAPAETGVSPALIELGTAEVTPPGAEQPRQPTVALSLRGITRCLAAVIVVLTVLNLLVLYGADTGALDPYPSLYHWFTVDHEDTIPAWFASVLLLVCAGLLALNGGLTSNARFARYWFALAAIFVLLSIDEAVSIHEALSFYLQQAFQLTGLLFFAWVIPGAIFVAFVGLVYLPFVAHLPAPTRWRVLLAASLYVLGALGMELLGGWYFTLYRRPTLIYLGIATIEEVLELGGLMAFIHALLFHLRTSSRSVVIEFTG